MVDSIYRTRSLGVAAQGIPDQYADGKAAKVWEYYIGSRTERTDSYRHFLVDLLKSRQSSHILDVACGTGIDSMMLLEEGFQVMSCDASDKMVLHAFRERWERRKEDCFDKWEIEVANWLTLPHDISKEGDGFDAIICLGNSFAHLPDFEGTQENQLVALRNFATMLKPGGILIIDHRNYDAILDTGRAPIKNIYYKGNCIKDIQTSVLYVNGRPSMVTLDYFITVNELAKSEKVRKKLALDEPVYKFRLSYYPHRLNAFTDILKKSFGENAVHSVFGDFKPFKEGDTPSYYIHVIEKPLG
ncbi:glycine N-methyltransferase-like [Acanthaster planci]|uniref:Glycine N-methyltransferase n=1 Tax=Acanthaster planci TaxID=133434 RepID=A0A8B7XL19_ACAPL|nr:glycine N-methyltransferase-like [Acanthaster planci]XP_022081502.1 glycine N-methyltransferase-like [Acanthaster planci]XP_022081503.1 glycine N-methyltransferase-like [Acanthaster planci]